jgi:beta propeller repeat protein
MRDHVSATRLAIMVTAVCVLALPSAAFGFTHTIASPSVTWKVPTAAGNQYAPAIYGFKIAYEDFALGNSNIWSLNLADHNTQGAIADQSLADVGPSMWGDRVVWTASTVAGTDVAYRDGPSGAVHTLTRAGSQGAGDVWGDRIVFTDTSTGAGDIYMWTAGTTNVTPICTEAHAQSDPTVFGDIVVWVDSRNGNQDLYMYDLRTDTERQLTNNAADEYSPDLWGTTVAFISEKNGTPDAARVERITDTDLALPDVFGEGGDQSEPSIWNERIVWSSADGEIWGIDPYYAAGNTPVQLTDDPTVTKQHPSIFGDLVVYGGLSASGADIYCAKVFYPQIPLKGPGTIAYGGSVTLTGVLTAGVGIPAQGRPLGLQVLDAGGWSMDVGTNAIALADGTFSFTKSGLQRSTWFRAVYGETAEDFLTGAGAAVLVPVKASLSKPSGPSRIKHGKSFTSVGALKPWHAAGTAWVTIKAYKRIHGHYYVIKSVTADLSDFSTYSHYAKRFSLPSAGRWKIVAQHADSDHAATSSSARYITVY